MRKILAAVAAMGFVAMAMPSQASDLAVRRAPTKAPAPVYAPVAVNPWAGFYFGPNGGVVWERFGDTPRISTSDGFFGAQAGYNWVGAGWLYGIEGDLQGAFQHVGTANGTCGAVACTVNARMNAFGTIRGRFGAFWGPTLAYVTGGAAFINTGASITFPAIAEVTNSWHTGYAVGVGLEQMLWGRISGKVEYLYMAADGPSVTAAGITRSFETRDHVLRAGLNYHF